MHHDLFRGFNKNCFLNLWNVAGGCRQYARCENSLNLCWLLRNVSLRKNFFQYGLDFFGLGFLEEVLVSPLTAVWGEISLVFFGKNRILSDLKEYGHESLYKKELFLCASKILMRLFCDGKV